MDSTAKLEVTPPFRVLVVCTMNICRSPAIAELLGSELHQRGLGEDVVVITSGGTKAVEGAPACDISLALVGSAEHHRHRARRVTVDDIAEADLVLTASSDHAGDLVRMLPKSQTYVHPLRRAAPLATFAATEEAPPEDLGVPERLRWLVAEMDASRGLAPRPAQHQGFSGWTDMNIDDIPDPHVLGYQIHPASAALIRESVTELAGAMLTVATAGS